MADAHRLMIRLSPELYAQLAARGRSGQPLAAIVRDALADYLARQPEQPRAASEQPQQPRQPVPPGLDAVPPFDTRKFVLGKLCPRGHEYYGTGQTLRRLFRHVCPACDVERTREARQAKREGTA
jgi:hypothetical protein